MILSSCSTRTKCFKTSSNKEFLKECIVDMVQFLEEKLYLELHPHKVEIRKVSQGIDFLGYIILPHAIVLRTKTKKRIRRKIKEGVIARNNEQISEKTFRAMVNSYLGVFSHARAKKAVTFLNMILDRLESKKAL